MTIEFLSKHADANWSWSKSELELFFFPGGEPHLRGVDAPKRVAQLAYVTGADGNDLLALAMWADAVRSRGEKLLIALPYLPGARADRGIPFGAKVYADFINNLGADRVICLDPHSPRMPSMIKNLTVYPVERVIRKVLGDQGDTYGHPYVGVIAPDKGAHDRAKSAASMLHVPVFQAEKVRDFATGKLSGFECEQLPADGKLLLVDDICDGGGTFIGLADHLNESQGVAGARLDLWVTHGIFSKGVSELRKRFDHIHTTNSWSSWDVTLPSLTQHNISPYLLGDLNNA